MPSVHFQIVPLVDNIIFAPVGHDACTLRGEERIFSLLVLAYVLEAIYAPHREPPQEVVRVGNLHPLAADLGAEFHP